LKQFVMTAINLLLGLRRLLMASCLAAYLMPAFALFNFGFHLGWILLAPLAFPAW